MCGQVGIDCSYARGQRVYTENPNIVLTKLSLITCNLFLLGMLCTRELMRVSTVCVNTLHSVA